MEEPCKCHGERAAGSTGRRSSGERRRVQGAVTEGCVVLSVGRSAGHSVNQVWETG